MSLVLESDVSVHVARLRAGERDAATELWRAFFVRLVRLARRRVRNPAAWFDAEDAALSVLDVFCRGIEEGRFAQYQDRHAIWALLATILKRKLRERYRTLRALKNGGGQVQLHPDLDQLVMNPRDSVVLGAGALVVAELLESLPDERMRLIAAFTLEGYSTGEIADRLGCSSPTVRRKLSLLRTLWSHHLA